MTPEFNLCDVCNAKVQSAARIKVAVSCIAHPDKSKLSGNASFDLCGLCACSLLKKLVDHVDGNNSHDMAEWLAAQIKSGRQVHPIQE